MNRIFASKAFKSSSRPDKIIAAMQNPINLELIKQVSSYLDEPYQDYTRVKRPQETEQIETDEDKKAMKPSVSHDSHSSAPKPPVKPDMNDAVPHDVPDAADTLSDNTDSDESSKVEESTQIKSATPVTGSCVTVNTNDNIIHNLPKIVDEIAGLLNADGTTAGVSRIMIKDNSELWIHYQDTVNLNNVMSQVIMMLSASGYTYLVFNRLARSENAIVFEITSASATQLESVVDKVAESKES